MKPSKREFSYILEVCSKRDHYFRMFYASEEKAIIAANGFLRAMRESPADAVAMLWSSGTMATIEGVSDIKVPVFAIRAGEIGSVCLREYEAWMGQTRTGRDSTDEGEKESWQ